MRFRREAITPALLLLGLLVVIVRAAWLCDDAYISFRTLENLAGGLGLRWNPAERVQVFTHPLWVLLLAPARLLTGEIYYTSLTTSLLLSAAALLGVARAAGSAWRAAVALVALGLSRAFVDYSTSGLENPLAHLLLVLFFLAWLRARAAAAAGRGPALRLALLAGLLVLVRPDLLLLCGPPLLSGLAAARPPGTRPGSLGSLAGRGRILLLGFLPLLAWLLFALIYYGSPLPNTAHAKLGAGLPAAALAERGAAFLLAHVTADPVTVLVLLGGVAAAVLRRDRGTISFAAGIGLYLLYLVAIGGDFMLGRMLTPPLVTALLLAVRQPALARPGPALAAVGVLLVAGIFCPHPPPLSGPGYGAGLTEADVVGPRGIADERAYYYPHTSLLGAGARPGRVDHPWALNGRRARLAGESPLVKRTVGLFGFHAGPDIHIVDVFGLTDPLLSRLPARPEAGWRVGHLERTVPAGYLETIATGENRFEDPRLARYWTTVALATRAPLLSPRRLAAVPDFVLGRVAQ